MWKRNEYEKNIVEGRTASNFKFCQTIEQNELILIRTLSSNMKEKGNCHAQEIIFSWILLPKLFVCYDHFDGLGGV